MSDYVPEEVTMGILTSLPSKSLVRFRCVSKSWNSLITNPFFIDSHLKKSTLLSETYPLLFIKSCFYRYSLYFDDKSFHNYLELELSDKWKKQLFHVVGSCNGLVCLLGDEDWYRGPIMLWNPSIRKELELPLLRSVRCGIMIYRVGFGFDMLNDDYKVITIMGDPKAPSQIKFIPPIKAALYSLNAGSWKSINVNLASFDMLDFQRLNQAFVNGAVHWLGKRKVKGRNQSFVLKFDLSNELFEEIMLPEDVANNRYFGDEVIKVSVSNNSLAVFRETYGSCDVWVMEEYGVLESWTRRFFIRSHSVWTEEYGARGVCSPRSISCMPIIVRKNGELLMYNRRRILSYDPRTRASHDLQNDGKLANSLCAVFYVESLVLLDKSSKNGKEMLYFIEY